MTAVKRYIPWAIILVGIVSVVMGIVFIATGIKSKNFITAQMQLEKATYTGQPQQLLADGTHLDVDGTIDGVVDTAYEAKLMSDTLKAHRANSGYYTELDRDDPGRATILNAMTMENSLNMAQMGFGLADFALGAGVTLLIVGVGFGAIGLTAQFKKE
ncbi:hypothetical protein ACFLVP_04150 [Chloroflexota bacterium]